MTTPPSRRQPGRVTIKDVAAAASVSVSAVSYALNDTGQVSPQTRDRIRQVARELGYRPNAAARGLVKGTPGLLAIVPSVDPAFSSFLEIEYLAEVVAGAVARSTALGRALVVAPAAIDERLWDTLSVDGVVVVDPRVGDPRVADLRARGVPMVTVDRDPSNDDRWYVDTAAAAGTRDMLEHLSPGGVRSVALVTWQLEDSFNLDSEQEYVAWAREHGREPLVERWEPPRYGVDLRRAEALVRRSDVDAVYCLTQRFAASVLDAARLAGRLVPDDLLVASAGDSRVPEGGPLGELTTLDFSGTRLGQAAVDLLVRRIAGQRLPPLARRTVASTLHPRGTTAAPTGS